MGGSRKTGRDNIDREPGSADRGDGWLGKCDVER